MSTRDTDYSNTIIYKITCKDPNIHDVYVGHTVNFVQRKKAHQLCCMNPKSDGYNCKVYRVIRNNGGWDNWDMCIIAFYNCKDLHEARQKEQEHFVALNATLNSVEPFPSKHVKRVKNVKRVKRVNRIIHVNPARLNTSTYNQNIPSSNRQNKLHNCEPCNFVTTCKRDYERHLLTQKHIDGGGSAVTPIKTLDGYSCPLCHKLFKSRTSVYKHTPVCNTSSSQVAPVDANPADDIICADDKITITKDMFMMLLRHNQEMLKIIKALAEQRSVNTPDKQQY